MNRQLVLKGQEPLPLISTVSLESDFLGINVQIDGHTVCWFEIDRDNENDVILCINNPNIGGKRVVPMQTDERGFPIIPEYQRTSR